MSCVTPVTARAHARGLNRPSGVIAVTDVTGIARPTHARWRKYRTAGEFGQNSDNNKGHPLSSAPDLLILWLRGVDLNHRPLGYEPNELPDCSTPHFDHTEM